MSKIAQVEAEHEPKPDTIVAEHSAAEDWAESARESVADTTENGRIVLDLVAEQTRQGIATLNAFNGATNWAALAQAQSDFMAGSFARIKQINERYRELFWSGAKHMRFPT